MLLPGSPGEVLLTQARVRSSSQKDEQGTGCRPVGATNNGSRQEDDPRRKHLRERKLAVAEKNGVPRQRMTELLSETLFSSVIYRGYGDLIARHAYEPAGFRLSLGWKDNQLVLDIADEA